jgi:C4-dicarboxylate-specific signal transduction histidine kinase
MTDDIHDIRVPPAASAMQWTIALGATLVAAALLSIWIWRRRRRRAPRPEPAHERALQELEEARALLRAALAAEFCTAASDIVRRYIEQAFRTAVRQRTTEEFLQSLLQSEDAVLTRHRARLTEFFEGCDLVKFSGPGPTPRSLESLYESARTIVRETAAEAHAAVSAT